MTNKLKTVQNPRLILVDCDNAFRISNIISDILNHCSYNTLIDCFLENTDFVILTHNKDYSDFSELIADTVVLDEKSESNENVITAFKNKVMSYEYCLYKYGEDVKGFTTYSYDHYDTDVMCKNIIVKGNITSFDIINDGILSRVRISTNMYSIKEVLVCTCILIATGIPIASILGYFNAYEGK